MIQVKLLMNNGFWYLIPNELEDKFLRDIKNENNLISGKFDEEYDQYRTGGSPNQTQLYIAG